MAFIEGRLKLEWPVPSCLAANRAWACAQNIPRHTGWHTYGQWLTLPQVSVYCTEKWVGKGSSELSGRGPLLRGPLALSSVARLFDALGKAPDVPGVCERGLLGVALLSLLQTRLHSWFGGKEQGCRNRKHAGGRWSEANTVTRCPLTPICSRPRWSCRCPTRRCLEPCPPSHP